jgi:hypothetical protein
MSVRFDSPVVLFFTRITGAAAAVCLFAAAGCTNTPSAAQRLDEAYKASGMKRVTVFPLGGTVTIDNEPPTFKNRRTVLVVMAYDASKPDAPASGAYVPVKADGAFEFPDGGLTPGKYVLLFAVLDRRKKQGMEGPDLLKNLYNDPDVNGKKEGFTINLEASGKTDCQFNLSVTGESAKPPGPKALTHIET